MLSFASTQLHSARETVNIQKMNKDNVVSLISSDEEEQSSSSTKPKPPKTPKTAKQNDDRRRRTKNAVHLIRTMHALHSKKKIAQFFCFIFENAQREYFLLISGQAVNESDILVNAEYELFKADFNLYLVYGNYINTHLSDLKFLRHVIDVLPKSLEMYKGRSCSDKHAR